MYNKLIESGMSKIKATFPISEIVITYVKSDEKYYITSESYGVKRKGYQDRPTHILTKGGEVRFFTEFLDALKQANRIDPYVKKSIREL